MNINTLLKFLCIVLIMCMLQRLAAQGDEMIKGIDVKGLYLSYDDFIVNRLFKPVDWLHKSDKIKLKQFFISPEIVSIEEDKETVYYKDSIFAIKLSNNENYRFINRSPCLIADTSGLYIYIYKTTKNEYKKTGPYRRTKEVPVTYYYFSAGDHKSVYMLTLANLKEYAITNTNAHAAVFSKFTTDEMLYEINSLTGRFEINETLHTIIK